MKKLWLVATITYRRRIRSGTFLFLTFGLPVIMIIAGAVPILQLSRDTLGTVGIVDQTGELAAVESITVENDTLELVSYADADTAETALLKDEIEGYLVIPAGYFTGEVPRYYAESEPGEITDQALIQYMQRALLPDAPQWQLERLTNPGEITYASLAVGEELSQGPALIIRIVAPIALAVLFSLMVYTSISQMGAAIVQEKDDRSMEMIITSLRARELVTGKVLGMTLLSLTQITIWVTGGLIAAGLALAGDVALSDISIPLQPVFWAAVLGLPGYFLFAVIASGLGIIAGDKAQAQQLAGVLGLVAFVPLWLIGVMIEAPDGALSVGLTLFPLTSPMFALVRMVFSEVPLWQLVTAAGLLVIALGVSIWGVTRIFRAAMLMYGQSFKPRQIWQALLQT